MLSPVQKDATLLANNSRHLFCSVYRRSRSATMLDPFARFFQHCRGHARSLRMDYKDLWVVFFPRCTAGPKLVGSCCIRLHTTANTHATTPNIVGATMLGVVAPVCTQPSGVSTFSVCLIMGPCFSGRWMLFTQNLISR